MVSLLRSHGVDQVDGITLDLGVSSMQLDEAERGFSFMRDAALDMRMSGEGQTAADLVNSLPEEELADVLYVYGEERRSRAIAKAIVDARSDGAINRTLELADLVARVVGRRPSDKIHPATKTFQGLRVYLNDEVGELKRALIASEHMLRPSGRLAIVAFQSIDDRLVKRFLMVRSGRQGGASRHMPEETGRRLPSTYRMIRTGAIKPSQEECRRNPRARSARLRVAERTDAPVWSDADNQADGWVSGPERGAHD